MGAGGRRALLWLVVLAAGIAAVWFLGVFAGPGAPQDAQRTSRADEAESDPQLAAAGTRPAERSPADVDGEDLLRRLGAADAAGARTLLLEVGYERVHETVGYDRDLVAYLVEAMLAGDGRLRGAAVQILRRIGPAALDAIKPLLFDRPHAARMAGLMVLNLWVGDGRRFADPGWVALLKDSNDMVSSRTWQMVSVGVTYQEDLASYCEAVIRAGPVGLVGSAGETLAWMGPRGMARLFDLLAESEGNRAASILGVLDHADRNALRPFLSRLDRWIRGRDEMPAFLALGALREYGQELVPLVPAMLEAWPRGSARVRRELLKRLEQVAPHAPGAVDLLVAALDHEEVWIRQQATAVLGRIALRPAAVLPKLRDALDRGGDDLAAMAIAGYGDAALPHLRSALQSPDADTRYFALYGVANLGEASVATKDLVLPMISDPDHEIASRAVLAAGQMGKAAAQALPAIWRAYESDQVGPKDVARALAGIGATARAFLRAKLAGGADLGDGSALRVLAAYPHGTGFALDVLDSYLTADRAETRLLATQALFAAADAPLQAQAQAGQPGDPHWITPAQVSRLDALLAARAADTSRDVRDLAARARAELARKTRVANAPRAGAR